MIYNRSVWDQFPRGPKAYEFFEDFLNDEAASATDATAWLKGTAINSGTIAILDSVHGGVARLSGAATTDDSGYGIQGDAEYVALRANTKTAFLSRVRFGNTGSTGNTVTQSDVLAGICVQDTSLLAGLTDGIYFRKADGAATIECVVERDSVELASGAIATLSESTWYDLAIAVEMSGTAGSGVARFFIDGSEVAAISSLTMPYESEEYLTPSIEFMSGDNSGTRFLDVDYLGAAGAR